MKIKPAEMEALKAMAAGNLEAALLAAVRLGATRSMEAEKPIKRAAEILEYEAEQMKAVWHNGREWDSEAMAEDCRELRQVAKGLRALIGAG